MPRKPRLFVSGATYHVCCRVARGEFVFDDPYEAEEFVEAVRKVRDLDRWKVLAWCLMGNHYHLVIKTDDVPLWRSMLRLQSYVARGFNRRRRCLGRLWQSRYRARLIDSQDYFRQVVSYVHLNPVAAGIVDDPADYPNSGHREILGHRPPRLIDISSALFGFDDHLARTSHRLATAAREMPQSAAFSRIGVLDVLQVRAPRPSGRKRNISRHLAGLATRRGEKCGLGDDARERYLVWVRAVAEARWIAQGIEQLPW